MFILFTMETSPGFEEHPKTFAQELVKRQADCNFRARSLSSLEIFQRISVELHRSNAVMTIARMSNVPAPGTVARQECNVSWAASLERKQTTLS